jgi:MATE family multidrug resistance protein
MAAVPVATAASNVAFITQVPLLLAATLGPHALAAFVSLEYLSVLFVQIPFAVSSASLFKVSSLLRSGNGRAAKGTAWLCVFMCLASGIACSVAIITLSGALSLFFSHDDEMIEEVAALLPLMALWQVWYGFSTGCYAVLEAAGSQNYSLWLKVSSAALVTLPLCLLMIYLADVGVLGLLWSMVMGQAVGALQAFLRLKALDWASLAGISLPVCLSTRLSACLPR